MVLPIYLKKILQTLLTIWGVITVIFFLFHLLPGDPARMMMGQQENSEQVKIIKQKYGFDLPLGKQYIYYINDISPISLHHQNKNHFTHNNPSKYREFQLLKLDHYTLVLKWPYFRESFTRKGKSVGSILASCFPNTLILAFCSMSIALIIGMLLGIISALKKDSIWDKTTQLISTLGMSIPSFFSAIIFAWLFGFVWHQYTGLEMTGNLFELDDYGEKVQFLPQNVILPAMVLGIRPLAVITQLMRNSLLDVWQQEYIKTARAKGLSTIQIVIKHAIPNAISPVITAASGWMASMLAGAVFVEYIFGWNGLGKEIVDALNTLDLPVLMGAIILIALVFIFVNIFVDMTYKWLDPRVE